MKMQGAYKIANQQRGFDTLLDPLIQSDQRLQRIIESLRLEIVESGCNNLRIRQVFQNPREIYRLEIHMPELGYQRTTLLDRDALEELLAADGVREAVGITEPWS